MPRGAIKDIAGHEIRALRHRFFRLLANKRLHGRSADHFLGSGGAACNSCRARLRITAYVMGVDVF